MHMQVTRGLNSHYVVKCRVNGVHPEGTETVISIAVPDWVLNY